MNNGFEIDDFDDTLFGPCDSQPHYDWLIDKAIANAENAGLKVIQSTATLILLDIDNGESRDKFNLVFPKIRHKFNLQLVDEWKSQHGNTHMLVTSNPLPFPCRIAIAASLGSDPIREALAIAMFQDGLEEPSVLFKPKQKFTFGIKL